MQEIQKTCPRCKKSQQLDAFTVDNNRRDGLSCWCKDCTRETGTRYREANRDKVREGVRLAQAKRYAREKPERRRRYELAGLRRFWDNVKILGLDECWEWQGSRDKDGYGFMSAKRAHRLSWLYTYWEEPGQLHVLHRCDNPPCCNPLHLFLGTELDNVRDAISKKRRFGMSGELKARLSELVGTGLSQAAAAKVLGISCATASRALHGRR